ncbi:MAG: Smr family protein, partial [Alphaproteobacteria bacterium]|nr:Smr family protein [Alphaproteobacteria bacterium]
NAVHNELRCVEIVTGRGSPERGTGQLKRMLPLWLQDGGIRPFILHIDENPASRGGSYLVLLRRARG